jgi:hypothetical protein
MYINCTAGFMPHVAATKQQLHRCRYYSPGWSHSSTLLPKHLQGQSLHADNLAKNGTMQQYSGISSCLLLAGRHHQL